MGSHGTFDSIAIKTTRDTKSIDTRKTTCFAADRLIRPGIRPAEKSPPREGSWSQSSFMLDVEKISGHKGGQPPGKHSEAFFFLATVPGFLGKVDGN